MSAEMAILGFRICFSFASMGQELMPAHGLHFRMAGAVLTLCTHAILILILQAVTLPQPK